MSVLDDVRSYAEIALEQGKAIAGQTQARLGSVSGEARDQANAASEDAKRFAEMLGEVARKQGFALLGAGDLAVTAVTKRAEGFSADARSRAEKAATSVDSLQDKAQAYAADLRGKSGKAVADAKGFKAGESAKAARQAVDAYVEQAKTVIDVLAEQAKTVIDVLAERGMKVAERLRKTPRLAVVVSLVDRSEDGQVSRPVAKPAAKKAPARKATVKKAPARKAAAKKAPAKKASTSA